MSTSLRPPASEGIDDALRTRLEGGIELLEDALPLLHSLRALLLRRELSEDDQLTLRECIHQLPRIDEAVERAARDASAGALVREVRAGLQACWEAASARLHEAGQGHPPSLRAALVSIRELSVVARPPRLEERVFAAAQPVPWAVPVVVALIMLGLTWVALDAWAALPTAVAALVAARWATRPRPWALTADRLHLGAWRALPAADVEPAALTSLEVERGRVRVQLPGGAVEVFTPRPGELVAWVRLLQSPLLGPLSARARPALVLPAGEHQESLALLCAEGVLVVPRAEAPHVIGALTPAPLPELPPLEAVLQLLAHLDPERWPAVAEALGGEGARWFGAPGLPLGEDPKAPGQLVLNAGGQEVRLHATFATHDPKRAVLAALLAPLTAQKA